MEMLHQVAAPAGSIIAQLQEHAFRCGVKTFKFKRFLPHPSDAQLLGILDLLVYAGTTCQINNRLQHHGYCILNACYAMFNPATVDPAIAQEEESDHDHLGGFASAVVSFMRAVQNMDLSLNREDVAESLFQVGDHIFANSEIRRARRKIGGPWGSYVLV